MRENFLLCKEKSIDFLDTPVAGAVPAQAVGTFMVGRWADLVKQGEPLLLCVIRGVIYCDAIMIERSGKNMQ